MNDDWYARLDHKIDQLVAGVAAIRQDLAVHISSNGHKTLEQHGKRLRSLELKYYAILAGFVGAFIVIMRGIVS